MAYAVLIIRLLISGVFFVSGAAKLFDFRGARTAASDFGAPRSAAGFIAGGLIAAELVIAVSLLFGDSAKPGAIAAFVLLAGFVVAIARLMARGEAPDCHCFGQLHNQPVGKSLLVRNVLLLVLCSVLVLVPVFEIDFAAAFVSEISGLSPVSAVFGIFLAVTAALVAGIPLLGRLRRSQDSLADFNASHLRNKSLEKELNAVPGLPVGARIADFELSDMNGERLSVHDVFRPGIPVLFIFVGPSCVPCGVLSDTFEEWSDSLQWKARVVLISSGGHALNTEKFGTINFSRMLLQEKDVANEAFSIHWTPAAVVVGHDKRIASRTVFGDAAMSGLVRGLEASEVAQPYYIGESGDPLIESFGKKLPEFELAKLDGSIVKNTDFEGRKTLIIFWSLTCSFCEEILLEIKQDGFASTDFELLVFADGDLRKLKAAGISGLLVHDPADQISRMLGKQGTPSAILVDENGIIISETAQAAPRIRMLAAR